MKKIILAAVALVSSTAAVSAYYPQGSNYSQQQGYSYSNQPYYYSEPYYSQPNYSQSYYTQPYYTQPSYGQPSYGQPTYIQPGYYQTRPYNRGYMNRNDYKNSRMYSAPMNRRTSFEDSQYQEEDTGYYGETNQPGFYQNRGFSDEPRQEQAKNASDNKYPRDMAATPNDRELNRQIRDKLSGWFSSGYNDTIILRTQNGLVIIEGTVKNPEDIQKINEAVRKIEGVRNLNNRAMVRSEDKRQSAFENPSWAKDKKEPDSAATEADKKLNDRIRDKLSGWFSAGYNETIILKTANGMVVIEGTVERPEDIQKISDDIRRIDGVQGITNRLAVQRQNVKSNN